jgi:hypothetical protein
MSTTHLLCAREYDVELTDAPDTEGFTTGLNRATVRPESMTVWETYGDNPSVRARLTGRHIKRNGEPGEVYTTVTVYLTEENRVSAIPAPQWVHDLHAKVVTSW